MLNCWKCWPFGKGKLQTDAQPLTAMDKMEETRKRLKKESRTYKRKASQEVRKEKEFRRAGDEKAASRCSEMKTLYVEEIEKLENSQLLIRKKIIILKGEKARTETGDALESGEEELKKMKEVKNTDDGDKTVDEMNKGMEDMNESEDSSSIFSDAATHFDGDKLETPLEEWEGADPVPQRTAEEGAASQAEMTLRAGLAAHS